MNFIFKINDMKYIFDGDNICLSDYENYCENTIVKHQTINDLKVSFPNTLAINMVNDCNLRCSYCYANQGSYNNRGKRIEKQEALNSIANLVEIAKKNNYDSVKIVFFGGEPLIEFDKIADIVLHCKEKYSDIKFRFGTITNGTLLTNDVIEFFEKNNFGYSISIDGDKGAHDKYRKYPNNVGSYDRIMENIKNIKEINRVSIRLTISNENFEVDKYIKYLRNNTPFYAYTIGIDYKMSDANFMKFLHSYRKLFDNYYYDIINNRIYDITTITNYVMLILFNLSTRAHCNAGTSYFALSSDSKLYMCHRMAGNEKYSIADLNNMNKIIEYSIKQNENIKLGVKNREIKCSKCSFNNICGGSCYYESIQNSGNMFDYNKRVCQFKKMTIINTMYLLSKLSKEQRNEFVKKICFIKSNYVK